MFRRDRQQHVHSIRHHVPFLHRPLLLLRQRSEQRHQLPQYHLYSTFMRNMIVEPMSRCSCHNVSSRDSTSARQPAPYNKGIDHHASVVRWLDISQGLLVVIDGATGLHAAVNQVLRKRSVVQRCLWPKRENVVSYLPKSEQAQWRQRLQHLFPDIRLGCDYVVPRGHGVARGELVASARIRDPSRVC